MDDEMKDQATEEEAKGIEPGNTEGGDEEETKEAAPADDAAKTDTAEQVSPEVNGDLLATLKEMGFGHERSVRALHFSGNSTLEGAINWVEEHAEDADIDTMLLVDKADAVPKKKLTVEEAKERAAELQARAKVKREAEERKNAKESERLRIQMGKELSAAAKAEEDQKFKRVAQVRMQEKAEMERARAKIQAKLDEDRRERRRKLGKPEELTEEEKAEEVAKAQAKVVLATKKRLPAKPVTKINRMREILVDMKKTADEAAFKTCCKTLTAYCRNVFNNMDDDSKRCIKLDGKALTERVASVPGGLAFLEQVGFAEQEEFLVMERGDEAVERRILEEAGAVLDSAMNNPMFGML